MREGEHWAYRADRSSNFAEVRILAIGVKRPPRVKVEFVEDKYEGKQLWASPARLEVEWSGLGVYAAEDARWAALRDAPGPSKLEAQAALTVWLASQVTESVFDFEHHGIGTVGDVGKLCDLIGMTSEALTLDPLAFEKDGRLYVPWAITERILRAAAVKCSNEVLRVVEKEERDAERESVVGVDFRWRRNDPIQHISGERCAQSFEEHIAPVHELLRSWIGEEATRERLELAGLRHELSRVGDIAQRAIAELKRLRSNRNADGLLDELLNPSDPWVSYGGDGALVIPRRTRYKWLQVEEETIGQPPQFPHNS